MKKLATIAAFSTIALISLTFAATPEPTWKKLVLSKDFYCEGATYGDFNKDGKTDIASGPYWYEGPDFKTKHEIYGPKTIDPHQYSENFLAFAYDFNNDGYPDLLVVGFPGKESWWFENPKGKDGQWTRHTVIDVTDNESPAFGDLTGDGKPELICMSKGQFGYAEPDWQHPDHMWKWHPVSGKPDKRFFRFTHGLGFGDVNGDGKADLLETKGWWEQPKEGAGSGDWKFHEYQFGAPTHGTSQMYAYDVNGDGLNDVVCALEAHGYGLAWFEQVKNGGEITFKKHLIMGEKPEQNKQGVVFSQLHAVDLVDVDGDGLKDIVTGKRWWAHGPKGDPGSDQPAVLYWFQLVRNSDKSVDFVAHKIDDDSGVGTQVIAADVNGDGKADVIVGNKKGTFVFLNKSPVSTRR
jgi:hypothetical protein